jgi:hypothetical protein
LVPGRLPAQAVDHSPRHLAPRSVAEIGHNGRANHNYDLSDFDAAIEAGNLPPVSFLKAGEYQDGHACYSDPIDEQHFLVEEHDRRLQRQGPRRPRLPVRSRRRGR